MSEHDLDVQDIMNGHDYVVLPVLQALCWGLHRWGHRKHEEWSMLAQDDVRGRELLEHMRVNGGQLAVPEWSRNACMAFLSTGNWPETAA